MHVRLSDWAAGECHVLCQQAASWHPCLALLPLLTPKGPSCRPAEPTVHLAQLTPSHLQDFRIATSRSSCWRSASEAALALPGSLITCGCEQYASCHLGSCPCK